MRIALSAGHNVYVGKYFDCGAYRNPYIEADITKETVKKLIPLLQAQGHIVKDVTPYNERFRHKKDAHKKRCRAVDAFNADLFLDIHVNAGGGTGVEVWVHNMGSKSVPYAQKICNNISTIARIPNRGIKAKSAFWSVSLTSKPAIIVEGGFIDSTDMNKLNPQNYAEAIAKVFGSVSTKSTNSSSKSSDNLYRVRKSWGNAKSQLGAFSILDNAIDLAEKNNGYNVYDENGNLVSSSSKTNNKASGNKVITEIQSILNSRYNTGIAVDGIYGSRTKKALIKGYQTELNKQFGANLNVDGIWGPKTRAATVTVRKGARGNLTYILQAALYCHGYDPKYVDGIFGNGTEKAVKQFQSDNGLSVDGVPGKNIFEKLFK